MAGTGGEARGAGGRGVIFSEAFIDALRRISESIVARDFTDLRDEGVLSEADVLRLADALSAYLASLPDGSRFVPPAADFWRQVFLEPYGFGGSEWQVRCPLYTDVEGHSDIELRLMAHQREDQISFAFEGAWVE